MSRINQGHSKFSAVPRVSNASELKEDDSVRRDLPSHPGRSPHQGSALFSARMSIVRHVDDMFGKEMVATHGPMWVDNIKPYSLQLLSGLPVTALRGKEASLLNPAQKKLLTKISWIRACQKRFNFSVEQLASMACVEQQEVESILSCSLNSIHSVRPKSVNRLKISIRRQLVELRRKHGTASARVSAMMANAHLDVGAANGIERMALAINRLEDVEQDDTNRAIAILVRSGNLSVREGLLLAAQHKRLS